MEKSKKGWRLDQFLKPSLSRILLLIGINFSALFLICILILSSTYHKDTLIQQRMNQISMIDGFAGQMNDQLKAVDHAMITIETSAVTQSFVTETEYGSYEISKMLRLSMDDVVYYVPLVRSVYIKRTDGHSLRSSFTSGDFVNEYVIDDQLLRLIDWRHPFSHSICTEIVRSGDYAAWAVAYPLHDQNGIYRGACIAICSSQYLQGLIPEGYLYYVRNGEETLFANCIPDDDADSHDDDAYKVISTANIDHMNWRLTCICGLISEQTFVLSRYQILGMLFAVILSLILILLLVRRMIIRPLDNIINQMESIDDFHERIVNPNKRRNELNSLTDGINDLKDRILHLDEAILKVNEEKNKLKLDYLSNHLLLLQTQINPHFLYNNLECIRGMAYAGNMEAVREIAVSMAEIARYCVKDSMSTIRDELECVRRYCNVITLRYGSSYTVESKISDALMQAPCPRMILQPIVENSISHGFVHGKQESGFVIITAEMNDEKEYRICIEDNGVGMEQGQIDSLNNEIACQIMDQHNRQLDKIGLFNIYDRLCLLTDPKKARVFLSPSAYGGLCVELYFVYTGGREMEDTLNETH